MKKVVQMLALASILLLGLTSLAACTNGPEQPKMFVNPEITVWVANFMPPVIDNNWQCLTKGIAVNYTNVNHIYKVRIELDYIHLDDSHTFTNDYIEVQVNANSTKEFDKLYLIPKDTSKRNHNCPFKFWMYLDQVIS